MACQDAERLPCTDGHPYFNFLLQGACQSHCQDNNISVNCADEDFLVSSVGSMQHCATVDFFVVAKRQG